MADVGFQALLDSSWAKAGASARAAWSQPTRMTAEQVTRFLSEQRNCAIATTSPQGEPTWCPSHSSSWRTVPSGYPPSRVQLACATSASAPGLLSWSGKAWGAEHQLVVASGPVEIVAAAAVPPSVGRIPPEARQHIVGQLLALAPPQSADRLLGRGRRVIGRSVAPFILS